MKCCGIELHDWKKLLNGWWIRKNKSNGFWTIVVIENGFASWKVSFNHPLDKRFAQMFSERNHDQIVEPILSDVEQIKSAVDEFLIKMDKMSAFL